MSRVKHVSIGVGRCTLEKSTERNIIKIDWPCYNMPESLINTFGRTLITLSL